MTWVRAPGPAHAATAAPSVNDRGAVTVEAALALCGLALALALAIGALAATIAQVRVVDAAAALAGLAARGEPERGRALAAELAPSGADLQLTTSGETVRAVVVVHLAPPLPLRVEGSAVAALEPDVVPP